VDLRTGQPHDLLAQLGARRLRVVVDDQPVDADGAQARQHQLQRRIQRVAVDDHRTTADQPSAQRGRDPGDDLGSNAGDGALDAAGQRHRCVFGPKLNCRRA
jgi:hypothetical protein